MNKFAKAMILGLLCASLPSPLFSMDTEKEGIVPYGATQPKHSQSSKPEEKKTILLSHKDSLPSSSAEAQAELPATTRKFSFFKHLLSKKKKKLRDLGESFFSPMPL